MANREEVEMREWRAESLEPNRAFFDGEERYDTGILVEAVEPEEIALHITHEGAEVGTPPASVYLSPVQAAQLEERLRTARLLASEVITNGS